FTSRSHGTSGPNLNDGKPIRFRGPGHIDGRTVIAATGIGQETEIEGPNAYILSELGSRHSDNAIHFLEDHIGSMDTKDKPFFLYYPSNSNHAPYTPDEAINGVPVAGAARTKSGKAMDKRHDFIYENDVALGRLIDWLEKSDDPRNPGKKLVETTLVIFTSDNGAEINSDIASGPFRSHKGSVYEGGHRVPFIVSWQGGGIGDGDRTTDGLTNDAPIGLQDLYATFAEIVGADLPDLRAGEKGAEDSFSVLSAFRGNPLPNRPPLFFNDHKEAKDDPAVAAMRIDSPEVKGKVYEGKWKLFFDADLLRAGDANPYELYDLAKDQWETTNLIDNSELSPLVDYITAQALLHRNSGGHRLAEFAPTESITFDWHGGDFSPTETRGRLSMNVRGQNAQRKFGTNASGLGIEGGGSADVNSGEAILISFNHDVIIESAALVAGAGVCGGFYQVGDAAPLAIYCTDADIDDRDQSGILSDIGLLRVGETLRLDSSPHFGVEASGQWRLGALTVRVLN
ncbi:MAG: sulfatase-like hydrolase/transferase, partial [Verrucomicrobia bacterium]|nr:sulfatase-like hydrolase/transferase [Verrucomicrobiota bacterium]